MKDVPRERDLRDLICFLADKVHLFLQRTIKGWVAPTPTKIETDFDPKKSKATVHLTPTEWPTGLGFMSITCSFTKGLGWEPRLVSVYAPHIILEETQFRIVCRITRLQGPDSATVLIEPVCGSKEALKMVTRALNKHKEPSRLDFL